MDEYPLPHLIEFPKLGTPDIGYISVWETAQPPLPFTVQRVFWTYHTPESIVRGRHAHKRTEQVLIAATGLITAITEQADGSIQTFRLEDPHVGLYIPPSSWHTMQYSQNAVQVVLASLPYIEEDYIRNYAMFRQRWERKH